MKKRSLTRCEDMRVTQILVKARYGIASVFIIIMFILLFIDISMTKNDLIMNMEQKEAEIREADDYFNENCQDYPDNELSFEDCILDHGQRDFIRGL